ncbi:CDP-diacylglycerol--glycerol-3-phosphate 3-phosphatidyltransferase [Ferrimonas lipolytica]|uniref:CDP-diacylglycerol--glycerol-3-phosphate 3-phosphatidyltransferase n=1 Tax=Ferrimonas lipolytica TaxID=2724191 RepID=A0A6H1UB79_9GAMM|nr:CDP-diacylglycerol--glycerol-3-phosphate 3-phosphatidyltransferase [Ferrimonas lipolytica]QIZ76337.1 CDP-diacylglycerol--glycerol-3-phosphate 3-phosphatidyltransferase [Ferrimonas lipolytica]
MKLNIPNILTLSRLVMIPLFVGLYYIPWKWSFIAAAILFVIASLTDALDGYLARRLNQSTPFGAFLDPVVDKLMVATALVVLVAELHNPMVTFAAVVMIGREIVISALREWMAEMGKRGIVAVSWLGKFKTAAQMASITGLIAHWSPLVDQLSLYLLYIATFLTVWSMLSYIRAAWGDLTQHG